MGSLSFTRRRLAAGMGALAAGPGLGRTALAQQGGAQRPVTIVVPFAAGGSTDVVTRLLAERMGQLLGQTVLVENRPGGNTVIGAESVARARPDGQTLLMAAGTTLTINPVIVPNLPYAVADFAPISLVSTFPFAIIAQHDGPADIAAMVAAARARPGQITYGTNGPTTLTNMAMLMVLERLGLQMQDVTYRGDAGQLNDFLARNLDLMVVAGSTALPVYHNRQGRLLGWTSERRVPTTSEIPTFGEVTPGLVAQSWFGLVAPARTRQPVIDRLHGATVEALRDQRIERRLTDEAQFLAGSTPAEFSAFMQVEAERWRPILARIAARQG